MRRRIAHLPGTYEEFSAHCTELEPDTDNFVIMAPSATLGKEFDDYTIIGTFWNRSDACDIFSAVHLRLSTRRKN